MNTIRVDVIALPKSLGGGPGHPSWTIDAGGARIVYPLTMAGVPDPKLIFEVRPEFEWPDDGRFRSYDELQKVADLVEQNGGYAMSSSSATGDEMQVGEKIVTGRNVVEVLTILNRRYAERAGDQSAAYRQGFEAGQRAAAEAVEQALANVNPEQD